jgi:hypothetical protein
VRVACNCIFQSVEEAIGVPTASAPAQYIPCCLSSVLNGESTCKLSEDERTQFLESLEPRLPKGIQDEILMVLFPLVRSAQSSRLLLLRLLLLLLAVPRPDVWRAAAEMPASSRVHAHAHAFSQVASSHCEFG